MSNSAPLHPTLDALRLALLRHLVRDYLTEQTASQRQAEAARSNHVALPATDKAA